MPRTPTREQVFEVARELGFDLAGVAPLAPPPDLERFDRWLSAGHHAGLDWLARQRDRIADPRRQLPQGRSILVLGLSHARASIELEDGTRIARYAAGRDYHNVVGRLLRKLRRRLVDAGWLDEARPFRKIVDSGPLLERSHAARAGLGFRSKAANLLHPRFGPWFFLAELLLELDLEPTSAAPALGSCGTCRACLDACPTQAIVAPGEVDARRCLSYHTIESTQPVPVSLRASLGPWAFGCDVCSEVCPWGRDAEDVGARLGVHPLVQAARQDGALTWLSERDEARFSELARGSPIARPGRAGMARNAALVLGNLPSGRGRAALLEALACDSQALVREAAAWSLARAHRGDAGVGAALERAQRIEPDPDASIAMRQHLAGT